MALILGHDGVNDVLVGNDNEDDEIYGFTGNDTLTGLSGEDNLYGGDDTDQLYGGADYDQLDGGAGDDLLDGGGGDDIVRYVDTQAGVTVDLLIAGPQDTVGAGTDTLISIEWLEGSAYGDDLFATNARTQIFGDAGNDTLTGRDGADNVYGGLGKDTLYGGDSRDVLDGDEGNDHLEGGAGGDLLRGEDDDDKIWGDGGNDEMEGDAGNDQLRGGKGQDVIRGDDGDDSLIGGKKADMLTGGADADTYVYGGVKDSTGLNFDTIIGFDALSSDKIDLTFAVNAVETPITTGSLSDFNFDADLAAAVNALAANDAVLFTPDAEYFGGTTFLIVDVNGQPGYQSNADFVIRLDAALNLTDLDLGDFI